MESLEWCDCFVSCNSESRDLNLLAGEKDRKVSVMTSPPGSACHSNRGASRGYRTLIAVKISSIYP